MLLRRPRRTRLDRLDASAFENEWGWEQLRPWLTTRAELPVRPLFCVLDGPTRGRPWSRAAVRTEFRAGSRAPSWRPAQVRAAPAAPRLRARARARGRAAD